MLKAGDFFLSGNTGGVVCAFVQWGNSYAGAAPAHIFHYSGTDKLRIGNQQTRVAHFARDIDLALFPVLSACEPSQLGKPRFGDAMLVNARGIMGCRVTDVSWSIAYVALQPGNLPGPGDSGTPVIQDGKVVGMLLSINLHTCKGIVMNAELIKKEAQM
ncbi:MAG: hypothetical protein ACE14P_02950 [Methanotrichaceae archaeon]